MGKRSEMRQPLVHIAPPGWTVRGFDRWLCGAPAYSHESCAELEAATCATCVAAAQLQREARGSRPWAGRSDAESRIRALEDALIQEIEEFDEHIDVDLCPRYGQAWSRHPDCPACARLEALIGHRRPPKVVP